LLEFIKLGAKNWEIKYKDEVVIQLDLVRNGSITNKFYIIVDFINKLNERIGEDFEKWFVKFLIEFRDSDEDRYSVMTQNVSTIMKFVNEYIDESNIDYNLFVDETKAKKNSILFSAEEIEQIIRLSSYLKVYSIISSSENLKFDQRRHKRIYNMFFTEIDQEIIFKIYSIIKTKTFRYNMTDRFMWNYIKMIHCKSLDIHVVEIFNFIMNSILVLCEEDKNPITYFVACVDESINWILRTGYKTSVIYDDSVATEDIHATGTNNLKTYAYNDTLGRLKGIAFQHIYAKIERKAQSTCNEVATEMDRLITEFQTRVSGIEHVSPICECLTYPILSALTDVPYENFKTLSAEHSAVLSVYVHKLLNAAFDGKLDNLFTILDYYYHNPQKGPAIATTYRIKSVDTLANTQNSAPNFLGFSSIPPQKPLRELLSYFCGRIGKGVSMDKMIHTVDGHLMREKPMPKIESDMITFFSKWFSDSMAREIHIMRRVMEHDF